MCSVLGLPYQFLFSMLLQTIEYVYRNKSTNTVYKPKWRFDKIETKTCTFLATIFRFANSIQSKSVIYQTEKIKKEKHRKKSTTTKFGARQYEKKGKKTWERNKHSHSYDKFDKKKKWCPVQCKLAQFRGCTIWVNRCQFYDVRWNHLLYTLDICRFQCSQFSLIERLDKVSRRGCTFHLFRILQYK